MLELGDFSLLYDNSALIKPLAANSTASCGDPQSIGNLLDYNPDTYFSTCSDAKQPQWLKFYTTETFNKIRITSRIGSESRTQGATVIVARASDGRVLFRSRILSSQTVVTLSVIYRTDKSSTNTTSFFLSGVQSGIKALVNLSTVFTLESWVNLASWNAFVFSGPIRLVIFPEYVQLSVGTLNSTNSMTNLTAVSSAPFPFQLDTWFHLAVVKDSSGFNVYVNGKRMINQPFSPYNITSDGVYIGAYSVEPASSIMPMVGFLSNIRISLSALYTSPFTPSLSNFPSPSGDVKLVIPVPSNIFYPNVQFFQKDELANFVGHSDVTVPFYYNCGINNT